MTRTRRLLAPLFLALSASAPAHAWGPEGHRAVAALAYDQLSEDARAAVDALLAAEPGATLESVANWADETRTDENGRWHYVNFPRGECEYRPERDCPDGQCVVGAIEAQRDILADADAASDQRLAALKYVVHFVGDVHQPLHGSFGDDRGGNTYQVNIDGEGSNLHSLWDSGMIRMRIQDEAAWQTLLATEPAPAFAPTMSPADWAVESCDIVSSDGFYPPHKLPEAYTDRWYPTVEARIEIAAARLAEMLEDAVGGS